MYKLMVLAAVVFAIAASSCAASPPECDAGHYQHVYPSLYPDGTIAVVTSHDSDKPLKVISIRTSMSCEPVQVDAYSVEGSVPTVEAVFNYSLHGQPQLFVIVSWDINHRGVGTYGKLYQVYAYGKDGKGGFAKSADVANRDDMTGIEGMAAGEPSHFPGKSPQGVKKLLAH